MEIKSVTLNDVENVVEIHENSFENFFLTTLGSSFLKSYYTILLKDMGTIFIGCFVDNKLEGFCTVAKHSKGFNKRLIKLNPLAFSIMGLKLLFRKPTTIIRLGKNLDKSSSVEDNGDYAEVLSIAASVNLKGKGVGKKMLLFLEEKLKKENYKKLSLTTDFYDNEGAVNFYKKIGYKILTEFITYPNRKMYRFIKNIK